MSKCILPLKTLILLFLYYMEKIEIQKQVSLLLLKYLQYLINYFRVGASPDFYCSDNKCKSK